MDRDATLPDLSRAHRHFAASYFNLAWTYLDKPDRSESDAEAMLLAASASLWHWMQRLDCTDRNFSIGYWQLSRIHATLGHGQESMRHALLALKYAKDASPFCIGYAHEAAARAAKLLGDPSSAERHCDAARACLDPINDAEERRSLAKDLAEL